VFGFLSRTIFCIGLLSLLLLLVAPPQQRLTIIWFSALTLLVAGSLRLMRGRHPAVELNQQPVHSLPQ
jgi:hypothetical protein